MGFPLSETILIFPRDGVPSYMCAECMGGNGDARTELLFVLFLGLARAAGPVGTQTRTQSGIEH